MAHIKINVASGGIEHGTQTLPQLLSAAFGAGSSGQVFTSNGGAADPSWTTGAGGGSGTVTTVSIVTANGISGSVATATTTPAITLTLGTITTGTWQATPVVPTYGGTGLATLTAHAVMVGAGTSNVAFATIGTAGRVLVDQGASADPSFASAGIVITQHSAVITTDTPSAGAVTCDLSVSDAHSVTLAASTLITLTNPATSKRQSAILYLIQSGAGSFTPTFTPTVHWGTAGTPVWSTTTGLRDIIVLDWDGTTYRGAVVGLGY